MCGGMQLLSQVLRAVRALHATGYAHRNIKPSNILRRLKQHDWILADLACAAPLGAANTLCIHGGTPPALPCVAHESLCA